MDHVKQVLNHWFENPRQAQVHALHRGLGFSGATHWQVEQSGRHYVLRRWAYDFQRDRLAPIHAVQAHLAATGLPVPVPLPRRDGPSLLESDGACWELAPWMPGIADYWSDPRPSKLAAACHALAQLHLAASGVPASIRPEASYISPALQNRSERLRSLNQGGLEELRATVERLPTGTEKNLAQEIITLAAKLAPIELKKSHHWRDCELPLQWCLRDVWHDHVLFTDDVVTGIIDFGAASLDSPAVDVVRLLGSMVGDDRDRWQLGLAAYEWVRPLRDEEREVLPYLDSTAVLLAPVNWVRWLYAGSSPLPLFIDRPAALHRLDRLVTRLRTLAATSRS
jgi:Ser/Thr protein kinase RdoA (MazF antagonist)